MATQSVIAADTPTSDPSGLTTLNAGYSPQTAAAAQRSQDLAQALAAMREQAQGVRAPDTSVTDLLAEALMQPRYGQSTPYSGEMTRADPQQMALVPTPQADLPQNSEVNFDDLIPIQGSTWQPSSWAGGAGSNGQTIGDAKMAGAAQPEWGMQQTQQSQPSRSTQQLAAEYNPNPSNLANDFGHSSQLAMNASDDRGGGKRPDRDDPWLDQEAERDYEVCRSLPGKDTRARCFSSAAERDAARRSGRPVPPLVTRRNESGTAAAAAAGVGAGAAGLYWLVSELSRLFPPRNLVPVP